MPEYDWMDTAGFERAIRERLQQRLDENKMSGAPYTSAETLASLAKNNRPELEERQTRSTASSRSQYDALASVDTIALSAINRARLAKRSDVSVEDIRAAVQANWCQIWPFCK